MGKLMVIGGVGELGRETVLAARERWSAGGDSVIATYFHSKPDEKLLTAAEWVQLDCSDPDAMKAVMISHAPSAVIYCAVPKHGGAAGKGGNDVKTGICDDVVSAAKCAMLIPSRFIAISTDQVFDGKKDGGMYTEEDPISPTNPYAEYKTLMESVLMALESPIVICRTSLILTMDPMGKGIQFVVDCLRGEKGEITLFTDELRNMTFSDDLGAALVELAESTCTFKGILNLVADEVTNRYELAKLLAKRLNLEMASVKSGLSSESGMNRPTNLSLDTALVRKTLTKTVLRGVSERLA